VFQVGCQCTKAANPAVPGQYRAAVRWKRGSNAILFALARNKGRAEGFFCGIA